MDNFQFKRSDRVSQEIRDIISLIISSKIIIEGSGLVTITKVKASDNLRFAKIYLSFINNTVESNELVKLMNYNIKEYRYHLGKSIEMQYVPQIKFYHDSSFEALENIVSLINKAKKPIIIAGFGDDGHFGSIYQNSKADTTKIGEDYYTGKKKLLDFNAEFEANIAAPGYSSHPALILT